MAVPLLLRVNALPDGRWRLLVSGGDFAEIAEGTVDPGRVAAVAEALEAWEALKPRPVLVSGRDTDFRRAEEHLGRALVRTLGASQELTQSYASLLGYARARGEPLVVVVDCVDAPLRRIPWELFAADAGGNSLEESRTGIVARRAGRPTRDVGLPDVAGVEVAVWCPTPDDPVCAEVLTALDATLGRHDAGPALRVDPSQGGAAPTGGRSVVLHVVCHGRRDADEVRLLLGDGSTGAPAAVARIGGWLAAADVVILDVCEAGATTEELLEALPARFLACGARAVVAPTRRCSARAAEAFATGFYPAWTEGRSLAEATAGGRNQVAALGVGAADTRWYNHVLYVPDARGGIQPGPRPAFWRPLGWPRGTPEAEAFLQAVKEAADRDGQGFVGVEHVAMALAGGAGVGAYTSRVRSLLSPRVGLLDGLKAGCSVQGERGVDDRGTPRLRSWASRLQPGFTCDALLAVLAGDRGHILQNMTDPPLHETVPAPPPRLLGPGRPDDTLPVDGTLDHTLPGGTPAPDFFDPRPADADAVGPAVGLEVACGPEDGRVLRPQPGDRLGRFPGTALQHAFYAATFVVDRHLHRFAGTWLGPGVLRTEDRCWVSRVGVGAKVYERGEDVAIRVGDVIQLTKTTRLRGVSAAPRPVELAVRSGG